MHVLFVCTGNICRSPTAERLAEAYASQMQIPGFSASSAGTQAVIGHPVHPSAAVVLEELGGDGSGFAARQLTSKIAAEADLVIAMSREHRDAVLELCPRQLRRTFTLIEAAGLVTDLDAWDLQDWPALRSRLRLGDGLDIRDPIGQSPEVFAQVGTEIGNLLRPLLALCQRSVTER